MDNKPASTFMFKNKFPIRFTVAKIEDVPEERQMSIDLNNFQSSDSSEPLPYQCFLREFWYNAKLELKIGDILHILKPLVVYSNGESKFCATLILDNNNGLLILSPDILISCTTLTETTFCMRKVWLSRLFRPYGLSSLAMTIGIMVHSLFQNCLKSKMTDAHQIEEYFRKILLPTIIFNLYEIGTSINDFITAIQPYIKSVSKWLTQYLDKNSKSKLFNIDKIEGIEPSVWSNLYGLIGKMDILVSISQLVNKYTRGIVPLELKTGRHSCSNSHMAQLILYTYLISASNKNMKSNNGYLIYLKDEPKTILVPSNEHVFRDLMISRNEFIQYVHQFEDVKEISNPDELLIKGPLPIVNERICNNCERLPDCSLILKCFDSKYMGDQKFNLADESTAHLDESDMQFFKKTISLLELEKRHQSNNDMSEHFWNFSSEKCESSLIGLSKMQIIRMDSGFVTFKRSSKAPMPSKLFTLNKKQIVNYSQFEGRRVVLSEEIADSTKMFNVYGMYCKRLCIAEGYVKKFSEDLQFIDVFLNDDDNNVGLESGSNKIYRLDFLNNQTNKVMAINFSNILRLMILDDKSRELRDIIIRGRFPSHNTNTCIVPSISNLFNSSFLSNLNGQQKRAVIGVLRTKCSLIYGSPGSGKTQTIVALVQALAKLGYSTLVTSFTHVAVDNILLKLMQTDSVQSKEIDFVRIGQKSRINPDLKEYSDYHRIEKWLENGDLSSLESFYNNIPIVASTCLGVASHPLFFKRTFDFCILDEASQVFLATSLGPLFVAKNFVLVGDQKQLPPVCGNRVARQHGLDESLFYRLLTFCDSNNVLANSDPDVAFERFEDYLINKNSVTIDSVRIFPLFIQYRMNRVIMELSNNITYAGKLRCANKNVELATLRCFLSEKGDPTGSFEKSYLRKAISSNLDDSVIFIDTDRVVNACENVSDSQTDLQVDGEIVSNKNCGYVYNDFEAHLIVQLTQTLMAVYQKGGLTLSDIGVISPFKRQVIHLRELFGEEFVKQYKLEINTVDQYQGRDKEVIIYSCVKSYFKNDDDNSPKLPNSAIGVVFSELLKDERRLNVAVTRAKKKLIIIGNRSSLKHYSPFQKLLTSMQPHQFVKLCEHNYDDLLDTLPKNLN
ncbi:Tripartite DNA replication factor [Blomia tropicalis]|nr:Tripartite DNA replication factor [Blomia tropicalis]